MESGKKNSSSIKQRHKKSDLPHRFWLQILLTLCWNKLLFPPSQVMSLVWEFSNEIFSPTRPPHPRWKAVPSLVTDANGLLSQCFCTLCIHTLQASYLPCKYRCGPADLQLLWAEDVSHGAEAALPLRLLLSVSPKSPPEESEQPDTSHVTLLRFHLLELNIFRHKKSKKMTSYPCSDHFGRQGRNSGPVCPILYHCMLIGGKKYNFLAKIARR